MRAPSLHRRHAQEVSDGIEAVVADMRAGRFLRHREAAMCRGGPDDLGEFVGSGPEVPAGGGVGVRTCGDDTPT